MSVGAILDPLCIILVKSGAHGGRLLFRYPYSNQVISKDSYVRSNPYSLLSDEFDRMGNSEDECKSNIRNGQLDGFSDETLVNILAVSKCLCDAKFELKVNDVRFVGHPLFIEQRTRREKRSGISMFHLVFAIPAEASYSIILCYHDFSKIISLVLKHEEERVGYLSQQSITLLGARDEIENLPESEQGHPFDLALRTSLLAQEIESIYQKLCRDGEVRQYINKWIELSFCLPQKLHRKHFPNILVEPELIYECLENLKPYHAILLLDDVPVLLDSLTTDASSALRRLITLASPEKSLKTLAVDLDLSLLQVLQLTGHLLYWGRATVIYPICENNLYVLSPSLTLPIPQDIKKKFSNSFPDENIYEVLTAFNLPRTIVLPPTQNHKQEQFLDEIVFLLKQHMIIQTHTYLCLAVPSTSNGSMAHWVQHRTKHVSVTFKVGSPISERSDDSDVTVIDDFAKNTIESPCKDNAEDILSNLSADEKDAILSVPASDNLENLQLFVDLAKYFDGNHHIEEIMYHENIGRSELVQLIDKFRTILIKHEHEDPAVSMYFTKMETEESEPEKFE